MTIFCIYNKGHNCTIRERTFIFEGNVKEKRHKTHKEWVNFKCDKLYETIIYNNKLTKYCQSADDSRHWIRGLWDWTHNATKLYKITTILNHTSCINPIIKIQFNKIRFLICLNKVLCDINTY